MGTGLQHVFLIGAPRSGTTWLQELLGDDPRVVTPQETDVFQSFVAPLVAAWEHTLRGGDEAWAERRHKGLPAVLRREQFDAAVVAWLDEIWSAVHACKPEASVLVEKSPSHSRHAALIARYVPDARFVHIVRDGRDVAASLVAAAQGWGAGWAPRTVAAAAAEWADHVRPALALRDGAAYCEVRYEALRGPQAAGELARVAAFCGTPLTAADAAARLGSHSIEGPRSGGRGSSIVFGGEAADRAAAGSEPEGFVGRGSVGGWRETWTAGDRVAFAAVAGDLLVELGDEPDDAWLGDRATVARERRRRSRRALLARALRRASTDLRRAAERAGGEGPHL